MFKLHAEKSTLELKEKELLVSGSVNIYKAQFTFSEEWDGLSKTAVFRAGKKAISVILEEDKDYTCVVPWEVLKDYGRQLNIGVYGSIDDEPIETLMDDPDMPPMTGDMMDEIIAGYSADEPEGPKPEPESVVERIVRPTVWVEVGTIYEGTEQGENALPPTPDVTKVIFTELNGKQGKLIGMQGQMVGFDAKGEAEAQTVEQPKRYARFVVGTSTAGWTANDCDYLCDGADDQVEINAAIQALPSTGGEVVILDGTYNLTGSILVNKAKVTLSGNGQSTVLKRAFEGSGTQPGLIYVTSSYNTIRFLHIDGNKKSYNGVNNSGISMRSCVYIIISESIFLNNSSYGICDTFGENITIIGNIFRSNGYGICASMKSGTITGNICRYNSNSGIYVSSYAATITGNTCNDNTYGIILEKTATSANKCTVTGNTCNTNTYGIKLSISSSTVAGNTCTGNNYGIILDGSAKNNTVTGNTITRGEGLESDYESSHQTIYAKSNTSNNLVLGNNIMGKDCLDAGSNNTLAYNKYN